MSRTHRVDVIVNHIVEMVQSGDFGVDAHLSTKALAEHFKVSRTPIRKALEILADRQIIEQRPNLGYFTKPAREQIAHIDVATPEDEASEYYMLAEDWVSDRIPEEVTEQFLRDRYDLTRTQVAAMLSRAAEEGWVERKRGYGWRLLPVVKTSETLEQVYRLRAILEPAALLESTFKLDRQVLLAQRRAQLALLEGDIERLPANRLLLIGMNFHEEILNLAQNPILLQALQRINRLRRLIEYRSIVDRSRLYKVCREHLAILDAIEQGDNIEAAHLMRHHLSGAIATKSPVARLFNSEAQAASADLRAEVE
jgi:DNA-binding GntR family transcriptional regulator